MITLYGLGAGFGQPAGHFQAEAARAAGHEGTSIGEAKLFEDAHEFLF